MQRNCFRCIFLFDKLSKNTKTAYISPKYIFNKISKVWVFKKYRLIPEKWVKKKIVKKVEKS